MHREKSYNKLASILHIPSKEKVKHRRKLEKTAMAARAELRVPLLTLQLNHCIQKLKFLREIPGTR